MDTDIFSFKIMIHRVWIDPVIFHPSFLAIERPGFAVRLFNFPIFIVYGKTRISQEKILKNKEVNFGEGKSSSFEMNLNQVINLMNEMPLMISFLETENDQQIITIMILIQKSIIMNYVIVDIAIVLDTETLISFFTILRICDWHTMNQALKLLNYDLESELSYCLQFRLRYQLSQFQSQLFFFFNSCKILGKLFLNLNVFKDDIHEFYHEDKDNWKRKQFLVHDEIQNIIGKIDVSMSLTRKRKKFLADGAPEPENKNPNLITIKTENKPRDSVNPDNKKVEKEVQVSPEEISNNPDSEDIPTTKKFYQPSKMAKTGQEEEFNKTEGIRPKSADPTKAYPRKNVQDYYSKPNANENLGPQQPTLKSLVEGYYCPPIMMLKKKSKPPQVNNFIDKDDNKRSSYYPSGPVKPGFLLQKSTKPMSATNSSKGTQLNNNPFVHNMDPVPTNSFGNQDMPQPIMLLSNQASNALLSLQQVKGNGNPTSILDMLINELIALKTQNINTVGDLNTTKQSTGPLNSMPPFPKNSLTAGKSNVLAQNISPSKPNTSVINVVDSQKSKKEVKIATPIQEAKEDESYSEDFDSLSASHTVSQNGGNSLNLNANKYKPTGKFLSPSSGIHSNNASHGKKIVSQEIKDVRASISESYPEDFEIISQSQSAMKIANSNQKYIECYLCNEKVEQNKASEHAKICKKSALSRRRKTLEDSQTISEELVNASGSFNQSLNRSQIKDSIQKSESRISERYDEDFEEMSESQ